MLWYKAWLETRWRFLIGLALLIASAAGAVLVYPRLLKLALVVPNLNLGGELGRRIQESVQLTREYRGYVWSHWFAQNLMQTWTIFAVLLGSGGLITPTSGSLFTLSLPVSRTRVVGTRVAMALAELLVLSLVPSLLVPLISPAIGQTYGLSGTLVHSFCLFIAGTVFFSLAFLLSTIFNDLWRPLLLALGLALILAFAAQLSHDFALWTPFPVMNGETYFRTGHLPWLGLLVTGGLSAAFLVAATRNIARRDF